MVQICLSGSIESQEESQRYSAAILSERALFTTKFPFFSPFTQTMPSSFLPPHLRKQDPDEPLREIRGVSIPFLTAAPDGADLGGGPAAEEVHAARLLAAHVQSEAGHKESALINEEEDDAHSCKDHEVPERGGGEQSAGSQSWVMGHGSWVDG